MIRKSGKYNAKPSKGKKSQLEINSEKVLIESKLPFTYEQHKIELISSDKFCVFEIKKGEIKEVCSVRKMEYTPDFIIGDWQALLEAKGVSTPDFLIKWKLTKIWMKENHPECKMYLFHSVKDLKVALNNFLCQKK